MPITYKYEVPPPYMPPDYRDGMRGLAGGIFSRGGNLGGVQQDVKWTTAKVIYGSALEAAKRQVWASEKTYAAPPPTVIDWRRRLIRDAGNEEALKAIFMECEAWNTDNNLEPWLEIVRRAKDSVAETVPDGVDKIPGWVKVGAAIFLVGYTVRAFR